MKKVIIELYVDEVNDKHVGQALGDAIINNRIYYHEVGNEENELQKKLNSILKYCYPYVKQKWAATVISKILDCDFRDAKSKAEFVMGFIAEEE